MQKFIIAETNIVLNQVIKVIWNNILKYYMKVVIIAVTNVVIH